MKEPEHSEAQKFDAVCPIQSRFLRLSGDVADVAASSHSDDQAVC